MRPTHLIELEYFFDNVEASHHNNDPLASFQEQISLQVQPSLGILSGAQFLTLTASLRSTVHY